MAWDSKMPPFDLAELEQNAAEPSIGSVFGPGGVPGRRPSSLDCSVDLKLGGLGELGGPIGPWKEQPKTSAAAAPSAGPSKRARAQSSAAQTASCLVEGCKADLSKCRDYHRRHKVCEEHSKTQVVIVAGQQQRFCQQCSRFHLLGEFDEVKRSCRKRLDGHNRRRRKPQPDPMNSRSFFSNHQATRFTSYPQIFPTGTPEPNWSGIVKTEDDAWYTHQQPHHFLDSQRSFSISFSNSFKESKPFPFLHDGDSSLRSKTALEACLSQPLLKTSPPESSSTKMFAEGIIQTPFNSDCALSLLSSPVQTAAINLGQMVESDRIPMGQALASGLEYGGLSRYARSQGSLHGRSPTGFSSSGMEDEQTATVLVSSTSNANLHCQSLFHIGGEGPSDGASQPIPFSWQ